jgi:3-mercaptopyruvate sulfurtransferase SseA
MNLVSTEWLNNNLSKVRIFDASWHMPNSKRNAEKEYLDKHIPGAIFWNIEEHSDKDSPLPHMLSNSDYWTRMMWSFGIKNTDHIVVYDFSDVYSSCRSKKLPVNLVFTCGSGITATVLSLAYSMINDRYLPTIYDGSWAEYGKLK